MNTKDLKYYHKLILQKNFSKVANYFSVSQPTITMAIKRLEEEFHTTFFIRNHSHNELLITKNGYQFDKHVAVILQELQVAQKDINHSKEERITFGLPPIIGNYFFPSKTPELMNKHIMRRLEVFTHGSAELLKMIRHGDIDMGILGSIVPLNYPRLITEQIIEKPINIIVAKNHPLAQYVKKGIQFKQLVGERFVTFDEGFIHNQAFRTMTAINHFHPHSIFKTSNVNILKSMVAENLGISYLTSLAVLPTDNVVQVPLLDKEQPHFIISMVRRSTTNMTSYKQVLWDSLLN